MKLQMLLIFSMFSLLSTDLLRAEGVDMGTCWNAQGKITTGRDAIRCAGSNNTNTDVLTRAEIKDANKLAIELAKAQKQSGLERRYISDDIGKKYKNIKKTECSCTVGGVAPRDEFEQELRRKMLSDCIEAGLKETGKACKIFYAP